MKTGKLKISTLTSAVIIGLLPLTANAAFATTPSESETPITVVEFGYGARLEMFSTIPDSIRNELDYTPIGISSRATRQWQDSIGNCLASGSWNGNVTPNVAVVSHGGGCSQIMLSGSARASASAPSFRFTPEWHNTSQVQAVRATIWRIWDVDFDLRP